MTEQFVFDWAVLENRLYWLHDIYWLHENKLNLEKGDKEYTEISLYR